MSNFFSLWSLLLNYLVDTLCKEIFSKREQSITALETNIWRKETVYPLISHKAIVVQLQASNSMWTSQYMCIREDVRAWNSCFCEGLSIATKSRQHNKKLRGTACTNCPRGYRFCSHQKIWRVSNAALEWTLFSHLRFDQRWQLNLWKCRSLWGEQRRGKVWPRWWRTACRPAALFCSRLIWSAPRGSVLSCVRSSRYHRCCSTCTRDKRGSRVIRAVDTLVFLNCA